MHRRELGSFDGMNFDVVVIGAGINGARYLAAAGYSVLLVDKGDFGSGSTSRSTRMLHCGLRYFETPRPVLDFTLAPGKFAVALRMAKAAMEVRGEIVKDSPERVRAIKPLYPIFRDGPFKEWQADLAFKVLGGFGPADVPL
ncbi:MAG: FAD-dependent oxidoreductase [Alphaproteobacteria bacterium]|nr:FAD-dependent oxidoreductase [Alphaproteobacteria bacterium]